MVVIGGWVSQSSAVVGGKFVVGREEAFVQDEEVLLLRSYV
jgi:hypothetical protein